MFVRSVWLLRISGLRVGRLAVGGAVTAILVVGRYITIMAVNDRYITPEVGWLVGLRDYKRSA